MRYPFASCAVFSISAGDELVSSNGSAANGAAAGEPKRDVVAKLSRLLQDNAGLIAARQPPLIRNRCGYYLRGVLDRPRGTVTPLTGQGSHQVATLGKANALIVVPEPVTRLAEGDAAEVLVLP